MDMLSWQWPAPFPNRAAVHLLHHGPIRSRYGATGPGDLPRIHEPLHDMLQLATPSAGSIGIISSCSCSSGT